MVGHEKWNNFFSSKQSTDGEFVVYLEIGESHDFAALVQAAISVSVKDRSSLRCKKCQEYYAKKEFSSKRWASGNKTGANK
jgi:hypothetical protein